MSEPNGSVVADAEARLDADVEAFAAEVGSDEPVTIAGTSTRGGAVAGYRTVHAPTGVAWVQAAEMTVRCAAGTPVADLDAVLAPHGQCVALPMSGTVGGALAVGRSGVRRLGWGPMRDAVLQARYVSAAGELVKAGGPTVKNVSGFDLCRLLVGSSGTLGFLADVILRTRPRPRNETWFACRRDPFEVLTEIYRPTSVLWDGDTTWVLLDGHPDDIARQAEASSLAAVDGHPELPPQRWSMAPAALGELRHHEPGSFVAEIGVGIVHHHLPAPTRQVDPVVAVLHRRIKDAFDPTGRLNPSVVVLAS